MQRICDGTFHRFVVFREWSIGKSREWRKDATDTFGIHDERSHVIRRLRIRLEVRNVVANPLLLRFVPPNLPALHVPWFTRRIAGSAVVHDAAIGRPREAPIRINAETRWIVRTSSLHLSSGFSPGTGVQPVTTRRCAVVL